MLTVIDLAERAETKECYSNTVLALINDHVKKISVMTAPYFWHSHPDSEEVF